MRRGDLLLGAFVAAAVHAGIFSVSGVFSRPSIMMQRGESVVTLRLVPSVASKAAAKDNPVEERRQPPPEPRQKRRPPRATTVVAFKHPELLPPDELAVKIKAAMKERPVERPRLRVEVENPLVKIEDPDSTRRARAKAKPRPKPRKQEQAKKLTSTQSKEVEADLREKGVTVPAAVTGIAKPRYPSSCRRNGCQGRCVFEFTVLPDGACTDIRLIESAGCAKLDDAARDALLKARFSPAKRMGIPVSSRKKLAFRFSLEDE